MLIGGGESTASAIRSTLIHTITTPSVYQKLKKEIQLAVSEGRVSNPITFEEAKRLPYLQVSVLLRPNRILAVCDFGSLTTGCHI